MFVIYHHDVTYSSYGFYGNETLQWHTNASYIEFGTPANYSLFYKTDMKTNAQFWEIPVILTNFLTTPVATSLRFDSAS